MNQMTERALLYIGAKIAGFIALIEGVGWAALNGMTAAGSDFYDEISNYTGPPDYGHVLKPALAVMIPSMLQYLRSQAQMRTTVAEHETDLAKLKLEYELKLAGGTHGKTD